VVICQPWEKATIQRERESGRERERERERERVEHDICVDR
jgi:hypothetical protein